MKKDLIVFFRALILLNFFISVMVTWKIYNFNFNSENNFNLVILVIYGTLWFFSLYKIYNFSSFGRKMYLSLVVIGFIFNILSNFSQYDKVLFLLTVSEHLIIGSICTFSYFSKIKSNFT